MKLSDEQVDQVAAAAYQAWRRLAGNHAPELSYSELPARWREETRSSAIAALEALNAELALGIQLGDAFEHASALVHERWLERNRASAKTHQAVPYEELSESEKEKDRVFVRAASSCCDLGPER